MRLLQNYVDFKARVSKDFQIIIWVIINLSNSFILLNSEYIGKITYDVQDASGEKVTQIQLVILLILLILLYF